MTSLRFVGLSPKTLRCYKAALNLFFEWLEDEDIDIPCAPRCLDDCLALYLEHLWLDDRPITYAGHLMSAFRRFHPQLRWKLPLAKQYFSNWKSVHVTKQAVPLPASLALAFAGLAVRLGEIRFAAVFLLGYLCFLRTGEMVALTAHDLEVHFESGIVALRATKTSKTKMESVMVKDLRVAALLQEAVSSSPQQLELYSGSARSFRSFLSSLCTLFEVESSQFCGYSIRRGGASHAFASGITFDELLVRGRWQNVRTARVYLDSGRAALVQMRFTPNTLSLIDQYRTRLTCFCNQLRRKRTG